MKRFLTLLFFALTLTIIALGGLFLFRVQLYQLLLSRALNTKVLIEKAYFDFNKKFIFIDGLKLENALEVFIEKVEIDIPNTEATAYNMTIYDEKKEVARVTQLLLDGPSINLLLRGPVMDSITLKSPTVKLTRSYEGEINLLSLFKPRETLEKRPSLSFVVPTRRLVVEDGRLQFTDHFVSRPPAVTGLGEINLEMDSEKPPTLTRDVKLDIKAEALVLSPYPGRITVTGTTRPLSKKRDFDLKIAARDIDLLYIYPYYSKWCPVTVESGRINLNGKFLVNQDIQDSYYVAETYGLSISKKKTGGFGETLLGIPISSLISSLEDEGGHIVLDCYGRGPLSDTKYSPGPISQERFFAAAVDMLKKGIELFKKIKE